MIKRSSLHLQPGDTHKIRRSLKYSVVEGSWWGIMMGMGESYLSAFAEFLQATGFQLGLVTSLPQFLGALVQLISNQLVKTVKSRKWFIVLTVTAQAFIWPLLLIVITRTESVVLLIFFICLYFMFGSVGVPPWSSWMGDLVPETSRGRYFGLRNRIVGIVVTGSMLTAGLILGWYSRTNAIVAFQIIFSIAFVSRLLSALFLALKFEPHVELHQQDHPKFLQFIRRMRDSNFGMFTQYIMFMHLGVFVAIPAFIVYWLRYWELSYFQYMVILVTGSVLNFLTMTAWGAVADHYGNRTVLKWSSYVITCFPLIWYLLHFFPRSFAFPGAVLLQVFGGICWAGFGLSSSNFIYDSVAPRLRLPLISYHNTLKGIAIFLGGLLGGWLTGLEFDGPALLPTGFFAALLISFLIRLWVVRRYMSQIQEVRILNPSEAPIRIAWLAPIQGFVLESIIGVNTTLRKFRENVSRIWSNRS